MMEVNRSRMMLILSTMALTSIVLCGILYMEDKMDKTKNDLCADKVTLDYQAMLDASKIAYSHCIREVERHLAELRSVGVITAKPSFLPYLSAQWLAKEAEQLVIAAETMYTLEAGLSRSQLEVVNKPEIKEF